VSRGQLPRLHVVTDDAVLHRPDFRSVALLIMEEGGASIALHIRGPRCTGAFIQETAQALAPAARAAGAWLLVNDRVDVALAAGLAGAHLGQRSVPPGVARSILGPESVLGVSTHSHAELDEALSGGADYVFVGTIYQTDSHEGHPGRGLRALSEIPAAGLPAMAIGGIDVGRVAEVLAAGAHGVAVIGGVWGTPHPRDAVIRYLHALSESGES